MMMVSLGSIVSDGLSSYVAETPNQSGADDLCLYRMLGPCGDTELDPKSRLESNPELDRGQEYGQIRDHGGQGEESDRGFHLRLDLESRSSSEYDPQSDPE
ncbi:hypothetical protein HAX54_012010 [Datura stramonium]|uniref:Uncharacterized protein n=1 Tax=Datura stramonium TaxID=4076 RepID=A0ABS8TKP5_DATST|nr:hypothetical protein [Datura stramonium]